MIIQYPKMIYPRHGEPIIVQSKEEHEAVKGEYRESPADWASEEPKAPTGEITVDEIKHALKAAGFKDSQLKKKTEAELRALYAELKKG